MKHHGKLLQSKVSPKYKLFNTSMTQSYERQGQGHTILLPLLMFSVVGGTFLLVTMTRPITPESKLGESKPGGAKVAGVNLDGLEKQNAKELSTSSFPKPNFGFFDNKSSDRPKAGQRPEQFHQAAIQPAAPPNTSKYIQEGAVYGMKLSQLAPLSDPGQIPLEPIDELTPAFNPTARPVAPAPTPVVAEPKPKPIVVSNQTGSGRYELIANAACAKALPPLECPDSCPPTHVVNGGMKIAMPGGKNQTELMNFSRPVSLNAHALKHLFADQIHGHKVLDITMEATKIRVGGQDILHSPPQIAFNFQVSPSDINHANIPSARVVSSVGSSGGKSSHCAVPLKQYNESKGDCVTPWMTPSGLNQYILKKNCGHKTSFWNRGHWIVAVEGRQYGGINQYRIVYAKTPGNTGTSGATRSRKPRRTISRSFRPVSIQAST